MKTKKTLRARGSSFDSWLNNQGEIFKAKVIAGAMKRQFVIKLREMMKAKHIGVNVLQKMMGTGPSQMQRLLDPEDVGISLKSIAKLLAVMGAHGKITVESKTFF
ncbi:MAG: helix-turn-helix transcriptional regulator [Bdellovibrio sp.]|nr:helix-turn-helix transcriptional regulator [Bdellovibrio sp.]